VVITPPLRIAQTLCAIKKLYMSKKIEELNIEESKELIDKITVRNKQLEINKVKLRKQRDGKLDEKRKLKESKSKKMKSLQEAIKKTNSKSLKDSKRKSKERESNSFDSRISSKDKEIQRLRDAITKIDKEKAHNSKLKAMVHIHLKKLKSN